MEIPVPIYLFCLFVSISIMLFTIVLVYSESMPELAIFWYWKEQILELSAEFHLNIHQRLVVFCFFKYPKTKEKHSIFICCSFTNNPPDCASMTVKDLLFSLFSYTLPIPSIIGYIPAVFEITSKLSSTREVGVGGRSPKASGTKLFTFL